MKANPCGLCFREATVNHIGTFRNGRPAIDPRCDIHKADESEIGLFRLIDISGKRTREYRLNEIRRIPA